MLNRLLQNKYKLIAAFLAIYLLADLVLHKGLVRVMIQKKFPDHAIDSGASKDKHMLINTGKSWVKAVNTLARLEAIDQYCSGMECDVYFDTAKKIFDVHHDENKSTGLNLDTLLQVYRKRGLQASLWLDFKNLTDNNARESLLTLIQLRKRYGLNNKVLVESSQAYLLKDFGDSGFYTSFYTPLFNPYLATDDSIKRSVDSLSVVISKVSVDALSGYYFQYPFLYHYFPRYPILIWSPNDRFSLVNWWYKYKIEHTPEVFISLYN